MKEDLSSPPAYLITHMHTKQKRSSTHYAQNFAIDKERRSEREERRSGEEGS
jgi:hypothetical protein